jgi:hypothetical protein
MRRRSVLRAVGSGFAIGSVGVAGAHPTATSDGTPPEETPASQPLGTVSIEDVREAVVDEAGQRAYVATVDGFAVVDVADPSDMAVLARESIFADHEDGPLTGIWDLHPEGDRLLVAGPAYGSPSLRGFGCFDVSDPTEPELIAAHETDFYTHNCILRDGIGYFTGSGLDGSPLVILDVENGETLAQWSIHEVDERWAELPFGMVNLHDVWVDDGLAYLAYWDAGTWCLDVSDPTNPTLVSRVRGRPLDELLAIENRSRERTEPPGNDHFVTVGESGDLLGIGTESWTVDRRPPGGPGGIEFYDVSDPSDPERLSEIVPPPTPDPSRGGVWTTSHNFELTAGRCYASWYQGGVTVHDVSDPTDPTERYHWRDADRGKFWTAQLVAPGEQFLGASIGAYGSNTDSDGSSLESGLFAFPDPTVSTSSATQSSEPSSSPRPAADESDGPATDGEETPVSGSGDGLGVGAGLLGLGLGAWVRDHWSE